MNLQCRKVSSHGLENLAKLQEARARWLYELAVQESKLARVSRSGKVARSTGEVALRTCGAGKQERGGSANLRCRKTRQGCKGQEGGGSANLRGRKVKSHGLADSARLQGAGGRWLGELEVQESKLAQTRQDCKRHEGGVSANLRRRKLSSHGLADPARLQEARARWLGELAVQESKLARQTRQDCKRHEGGGSANLRRKKIRQGCKRHEPGGSANLRRKKVSSYGSADPARLQEARARWLGELAAQESKLVRVSRSGKVARSTSETRQGCKRHERGGSANLRCRKVSSHGLADPARLQEARARWLGELKRQESKIARINRLGKLARARAWWLNEPAVQESKLARVSGPGKVARGTSEVARRTCGAGK
ncbi:hypothetical protein CRG98_019945 [Punica granatum]|uniref:Uncharacterized protein n=1 Tax=Punica granatum TaxID=22663 RepID=A0A2I0JUU3_PUNGR|nr:hypothetical protein CRG98_019945 [Punica granatum]